MQEIIVYRNPLEAAMWHGIMDGSFFPVIVGVLVFFAVFLGLNALLEKIDRRLYRMRSRLSYDKVGGAYFSMFFAALIAFAVMYRMYSVL